MSALSDSQFLLSTDTETCLLQITPSIRPVPHLIWQEIEEKADVLKTKSPKEADETEEVEEWMLQGRRSDYSRCSFEQFGMCRQQVFVCRTCRDQLDRFLMKINLTYPTAMEEVSIVKGEGKQSLIPVSQTLSKKTIMALRQYLEMVACDEKLVEYIVSIVAATRPVQGTATRGTAVRGFTAGAKNRDDIHKYISFGASPRAGIALCRCAKAAALCAGRSFVLPEDIKSMAPAVLRHRIVLSYEAAAEGVTADDLIARILSLMPVP